LASPQPGTLNVLSTSGANGALRKLVSPGGLRADLFFRLNGITMPLPPLRRRPDDVLPLAEVFLERAARKLGKQPPRIGEEARRALTAPPRPGNVPELRNVIGRARGLCPAGRLGPGAPPLHDGGAEPAAP